MRRYFYAVLIDTFMNILYPSYDRTFFHKLNRNKTAHEMKWKGRGQ